MPEQKARPTPRLAALLVILAAPLAACAGPTGPQLTGPDGPPIANNDWNEHNYGMGYYSGPYDDGFEAEGLDGGPPAYLGDEFMR
ncbi:hypothetical protein D3W54_09875 [Komagataeibacter medellinensis]|uniref:Lipoprotein n=1 Tax=Komagataeibacter medellinensis TaxID=1177712 RepID=A0ABQ6VW90_9PROT|nr:hypothetical protein [Komagataeibacter medellinensis]KAB8124440.1 hypothetical protein D3W54_09875 [Komagataeibacter medellinensis]